MGLADIDDAASRAAAGRARGITDHAPAERSRASWETKDSGERLQFESGMVRDVTTGKTKYHLLFSGPMLERWAGLLTRGAEKYDDDNWMKANGEEELKRFRESAVRHFFQWIRGDTDEDHAAAVFFNLNGAEYVKERMR